MPNRTRRAGDVARLMLLLSVAACATGSRATTATPNATPVTVTAGAQTPVAKRPGAEFVLPSPNGHVNDLAGVVPDSAKQVLEVSLRLIRALTEGEIAVVTMSTLPGGTPQQMAQRIGNAWGVGARSGRARQAGTVVLVIPKETSSDGRGHCRIELGTGATAFIPDSAAGAMCEAAVPYFRVRDYPKGLEVIVDALARRYIQALGAPPSSGEPRRD
jgi:uncharacterized membrane protein YgcG